MMTFHSWISRAVVTARWKLQRSVVAWLEVFHQGLEADVHVRAFQCIGC